MTKDLELDPDQVARLGVGVATTLAAARRHEDRIRGRYDASGWGVTRLTQMLEHKRAKLRELTHEIRDLEELLAEKKRRPRN